MWGLRRELREEVGLELDIDPPHVWRQEAVGDGIAPGYGGVVNDYYLVRATSFDPHGAFTAEQLAAENVVEWRRWSLRDIADHRGPEVFSPRDLATPLTALIKDGPLAVPVHLGV